jgi:hypothetical protein
MTYYEDRKNGFRSDTTSGFDFPLWPLKPIDAKKEEVIKEKDHMQHQFVGGLNAESSSYASSYKKIPDVIYL